MKIGITAYKSGEHFGIGIAYAKYLQKFGTVIPLFPSVDILDGLDLVVLPGGPDLSPANIIEPTLPSYNNNNVCPYREYFYRNNLPKYIDAGVPIFGICLGFQQLNVLFGGGLQQDFPFNYSEKGRDEEVDKLVLTELGERFKKRFEIQTKDIKVNSLHHQGVMLHQVSKEFDILATAVTHGYQNVEAFIHKTLPIAGVQFHPEEINCPFANKLIKHITQQ